MEDVFHWREEEVDQEYDAREEEQYGALVLFSYIESIIFNISPDVMTQNRM